MLATTCPPPVMLAPPTTLESRPTSTAEATLGLELTSCARPTATPPLATPIANGLATPIGIGLPTMRMAPGARMSCPGLAVCSPAYRAHGGVTPTQLAGSIEVEGRTLMAGRWTKAPRCSGYFCTRPDWGPTGDSRTTGAWLTTMVAGTEEMS